TVKFDKAWKAAAGVVQKLVGHVAFAASTEESRPILNGVLWELRPDRMRMVATNGHRLAKMDVPASGGQAADLIVPPKALEQIRRLYAADAEIEIAKSDNHIGFRGVRSEEHTSELQSRSDLVCRLLLEKKSFPVRPRQLC